MPHFHDDAIQWKHFPRYWPFVRGIPRSPVNSPHKGQWRGALMFSLICARINSWVNNGEAGDLRRNRAHYDVVVMCAFVSSTDCPRCWIPASEFELRRRTIPTNQRRFWGFERFWRTWLIQKYIPPVIKILCAGESLKVIKSCWHKNVIFFAFKLTDVTIFLVLFQIWNAGVWIMEICNPQFSLDMTNRREIEYNKLWLVCDLNRTPNCYGKIWRFLCPFFKNLHLRENLARDCFTSTVSTVTNSVQNIFTHLRYCDK